MNAAVQPVTQPEFTIANGDAELCDTAIEMFAGLLLAAVEAEEADEQEVER